MVDAVTEFFQFEKKAAKERVEKDIELWKNWNDSGRDPQAMKPLLNQFKGLINHRANVYAGKNPNVPPEAVRVEFMNQAVHGFETYDPKKGAALHTHVDWQLKKARRFVANYGGGIGRIPENRFYRVGQFTAARDDLNETLGREPTALELADYLKWPVKQITALELEVRKEVPSSNLSVDSMSLKPSQSAEVVRLVQYDLGPEERLVLEHLYGMNGKPKLKPGQIATKLNMSTSKVSRIKSAIAKKVKEYLE